MQTLVFNTSTKTVKVTSDKPGDSKLLHEFYNVPTVRVMENHYEVIEEIVGDEQKTRKPVGRFPISNTNMLIEE
jgi:hypothetical protein